MFGPHLGGVFLDKFAPVGSDGTSVPHWDDSAEEIPLHSADPVQYAVVLNWGVQIVRHPGWVESAPAPHGVRAFT